MHLDITLESGEDRDLFQEAWKTAREFHGTDITFHLPGMIKYGDRRGKYPAVSITGTSCRLQCEHCRGKLLLPMIPAETPELWDKKAKHLWEHGAHGILITGGSDLDGRLPWKRFAPHIRRIAAETDLFLTAHAGFANSEDARLLSESGVQQALIDVMGDDATAREVYHLPSAARIIESLDALAEYGPPLAPHIVSGLHFGRIGAEVKAIEILRDYSLDSLVIVALTPLPDTPMATVSPQSPLETARLIARARVMHPKVPLSLGCERPRNRTGQALESLALRAGITRMAVWSEEIVQEAVQLGLRPRFQATCCSVPYMEEYSFPVDDIA